jgi:hypothetical protein
LRGRLRYKALLSSEESEWALITHPFHPFRNQKFQILKRKKIGNIDTLFLKGSYRGTFAVPREWTDKADPSIYYSLGIHSPILDFRCLLKLIDVTENLSHRADPGAINAERSPERS